jgi:NAD(P)-dependent dehydrogenase (short-subunit alcohol dehydrogenase family)
MDGKLVMVTGATGGIGYVTARELARMGARVIVVGRDPAKCDRVVGEIKAGTGNDGVSSLCADLSSLGEVRRLAAEFRAAHDRLDVLVNNAGAIFDQRRLSADGIEMTFALNHLSYFLLTDLLLDALRAAPAARIVNVASRAHMGARLDFDDLQCENRYSTRLAYQRSKLANVFFTYELAKRLGETPVTANALHPGLVATGFGGNNGPLFRFALRAYFKVFGAIDEEEGARTSIYLASAPEVARVTGRYFVEEKETPSSDVSHDEEAARRLWEISAEMVGAAGR